MANEFEDTLKNIESEILALKTATRYSSTRNASFATPTQVYTGLYRITYNTNSSNIFSFIYDLGNSADSDGMVYARTPSGNTQIIEVNTNIFGGGVAQIPLVVVSNVPVRSIVRL